MTSGSEPSDPGSPGLTRPSWASADRRAAATSAVLASTSAQRGRSPLLAVDAVSSRLHRRVRPAPRWPPRSGSPSDSRTGRGSRRGADPVGGRTRARSASPARPRLGPDVSTRSSPGRHPRRSAAGSANPRAARRSRRSSARRSAWCSSQVRRTDWNPASARKPSRTRPAAAAATGSGSGTDLGQPAPPSEPEASRTNPPTSAATTPASPAPEAAAPVSVGRSRPHRIRPASTPRATGTSIRAGPQPGHGRRDGGQDGQGRKGTRPARRRR